MKQEKYIQKLRSLLKWTSIISGVLFIIVLLLSFTDLPYYAYHSLGTSAGNLKAKPKLIVVLGGAGMPSPDGLMRCYYASEQAKAFPKADIIIALPLDEKGSNAQLRAMAKEISLHGVDSSRISFESNGFNTHSQAVNIAESCVNCSDSIPVLIVTSPEHMYRSVKTFRKAGFKNVGGAPTFEKPVDARKLKSGKPTATKEVQTLSFRYNMWSYLNYELMVSREYCAISYYWLKDWI